MKENTKEYIKEMLKDLEIQLNTAKAELKDAIKTKSKLHKIYKKVIRNC